MNIKTVITAVVVSLASLGVADLVGVPVSGKAFAQTTQTTSQATHQAALVNIMTANADNPAALRAALLAYLVANPNSGTVLADAVAQANPGPGSLRVIATAAQQAYVQLSSTGNQTAATALFNEVTASPTIAAAQTETGSNSFFNSNPPPNCVAVSCS